MHVQESRLTKHPFCFEVLSIFNSETRAHKHTLKSRDCLVALSGEIPVN